MLLVFCLSMVFAMSIQTLAVGTVATPRATATYNSVTLSWSAVSGADGYEVYMASGKTWKKIATTTSRTFVHKNLAINTVYKYRVRAYDKFLRKVTYGKFSATASAKTALAKVTGFKVAAANATTVKFTWNKVAGATGYQLYLYNGKQWVYKGATKNNYAYQTNLKLGQTYKYSVRAYRTVNKKNYYGPLCSLINAKCVLAAPTGVAQSTTTANAVALTWKAVSGATGYQVYLKVGSGWAGKANVKTPSCTISGLNPGTQYYILVRSYAKVGSSYVYSAYTSFNFKTAPAKVTGVTAKGQSNYADLKWNKCAGAEGYLVYRYDTAQRKYVTVVDTKANVNYCKTTGLTPETTYTYLIRAYNRSNGKVLLGAVCDQIRFNTYFADFTEFSYSDTSSSSVYKYSWTEVSGAYYEFEYFDYAANKWLSVTDSACYSTYAHDIPKYNRFKATVSASGYATAVSFDKQPSAAKYTVQVQPASGSKWSNQATTTSNTVRTYLAPNTPYSVRVLAYNGKYRVRACKKVGDEIKYTDYLTLTNTPGTYSEVAEYTTPSAAFNASSNESKTVYALKLAQAINNTKNDKSKFTLKRDVALKASLGKCYANGKDVTGMISAIPSLKEELEASFNENDSRTLNFENGTATYTYTDKNGNTQTAYMTPDSAIAPTRKAAYLYNQDDINNFAKKITSISVQNNADGSSVIKAVLAKESSKNGSPTPVHDGFMDSFAGEFADAEEIGAASVTVGATTITASITKDGKLNNMTVQSPFVISMSTKIESVSMVMSLNGNATYKYVVTR